MEKLFALEEGAREIGSLHEAENAAAKLQALLQEYNLERSQLGKGQQQEAVITTTRIDFPGSKSTGAWEIGRASCRERV